MKPLFGEFLIEKNVIAQDALASVLIEQSEQMATLSGMLYQSGNLKAPQVLAVMRLQMVTHGTFEEACRQLGFWSSEVDAYYRTEWSKHRKMLGELLVEKGHLNPNRLVELLEEYIQSVESQAVSPVFPVLDSVQLQELNTQFRSDVRVSLGLKVFELSFGPPSGLIEQFKVWVGVARFLRLTLLERVVARCVVLLESSVSAEQLIPVLNQALELIGMIQVNVLRSGSEENFSKAPQDQQNYSALMTAMDRLAR